MEQKKEHKSKKMSVAQGEDEITEIEEETLVAKSNPIPHVFLTASYPATL